MIGATLALRRARSTHHAQGAACVARTSSAARTTGCSSSRRRCSRSRSASWCPERRARDRYAGSSAREHDTLVGFFSGTMIHAHLVAVVFRSHGNPAIRKLYPIRFFVVPDRAVARDRRVAMDRGREHRRRDVLGRLALRRADVRLRADLRAQPRHAAGAGPPARLLAPAGALRRADPRRRDADGSRRLVRRASTKIGDACFRRCRPPSRARAATRLMA